MLGDVVIVSAARTAIGSFNGSLAATPAHQLGAEVIRGALSRASVNADQVCEVVMGQVLTAGCGQNPARQASIAAGVPDHVCAYTLNMVCGSGLRAIMQGAMSIAVGSADIVVAGGQENMSLAPHTAHLRKGLRMGDGQLVDTMISDGLWCALTNHHMGCTAENIADRWALSRDQLDKFAVGSQSKAQAAIAAGKFKEEIIPLTINKKRESVVFDIDEFPRAGVNMETLAALRPVFAKNGTVTAGNASGLNDGAAAVVLMTAAEAKRRRLVPLARIASSACCGVEPSIMGTGPIPASRRALKDAGWAVTDLDLIEANEAFAAQALSVNIEMDWDVDKVNVNGGAIALGHPIGASGARVVVTLLHEMKRRNLHQGLATLCVGGGMGVAMCLEA